MLVAKRASCLDLPVVVVLLHLLQRRVEAVQCGAKCQFGPA